MRSPFWYMHGMREHFTWELVSPAPVDPEQVEERIRDFMMGLPEAPLVYLDPEDDLEVYDDGEWTPESMENWRRQQRRVLLILEGPE
jgi:hypothetical protein